MKTIVACFLCTMGLFLLPAWTGAEESVDESGSVAKLEEIVVTATRQEEKIASVPANVSIITAKDIQNAPAQDVPELLRTQAGIHVSDISGNRRSYTVDLRGFGETAALNTLVLVDGRKVNQADLSGTDWTLIPPDRIERIEIIRGGRGSVLYGDNAAGGVINIITKEGRAFEVGVGAAGGSYETYKADARLSGAGNDISYALSGNYMTSDGYRDNSDTRVKDVGLNLDYYANQRLHLSLRGGYHDDNTGLPGAIKQSDFEAGASREDTLNPDNYADVEDYYLQGGPTLYFLSNSLFKIDMSYRSRESLFFSSFTGGTYEGDTEIESITVSPQLVLKEKIFALENSLTFGLDYFKDEEDITNTSSFSGTQVFDLKKENYGFYIHDELNVSDSLSLSGGYRYDEAEFSFKPSTPNETDVSENLYTAGINYAFLENSHIYFSYSRSFRYPVLDEFFNFQFNTISTDLSPQTSDDYEIGIRHQFNKSLYGKVNFFQVDTEDEIFLNPVTYANENLDADTCRKGVELSLTKNFEKITLAGTYAYTDATIDGGQFDDNQIPGVPEHQASIRSIFNVTDALSVALNGVYVGKRPFISDFGNDFEDQDDYLVLNSKIKYRWKQVTAFLDINNLTDEEYSEYGVLGGFPTERAYYPSPEINWLLGFSVKM